MKKQVQKEKENRDLYNKKIQFEEEIRKMVFQVFLLTSAGSVTLWVKQGFDLYSGSGLFTSVLLLTWVIISIFKTKKLIRKWNLVE
jgi:hypothetical protein